MFIKIHGVMVNAYELLRKGLVNVRGRNLRRLLGIEDADVELWIDSGGYQFLRRGIDPGVEKIAKLYREIDADYYISLDYPPSPSDEPSVQFAKIARTVKAFMELRSLLRGYAEEGRLVPVFHLAVGEALRLQLLSYEPSSATAAVGGLVPYFMQLAGRWSRLKAVTFLALIRKLWRGRLHALGLASAAVIPLLRLLGIDSGDTQTWRHKAAYGKIIVPGLGERHVSDRSVSFGPSAPRPEERSYVTSLANEASKVFGFKLDLETSFEARALFNAWVLLQVAVNGYEYQGPSPAFARLYRIAQTLNSMTPEDLESQLAYMVKSHEHAIGDQASALGPLA
jgi:queuine/archaeosine tRNA-ribosyltransferase